MTIVEADIWRSLQSVMDPEIPVISVVDMGIVREVAVTPDGVTVTMTPTFSGCPALDVMRRDIEAAVRELGVESVTIHTVLHPAWSTERISEPGRDKLRRFGLAPPPRHNGDVAVTFFEPAECPRCSSTNTSLRNAFGPTLCRMIWYCNECQDAFEQFKAL